MKRRSLLTGSISDSLSPSPSKKSKAGKAEISCSLEHLRSLFPVSAFEDGLPIIVLKHQLYSLHADRTNVDRHIVCLRDEGELRVLKLGVHDEDYCIINNTDYIKCIQTCLGLQSLTGKVIRSLLRSCQDVSVTKDKLTELKFSDDDITALVGSGVLLVRDVGSTGCSWWFGVPGVSPFIKSLTRGRGMIRQIIGRSKFKEMLYRELLSRKMTVSKLPMEYHIHDLIGADILERVETTSGDLLRLLETHQPQSHD